MNTFFISWVSGTWKSSLIPYLKDSLDKNKFSIYDFDERWVPDNVSHDWRLKETNYWLKVAIDNAKNNISTIICWISLPNEITESTNSKSAPEQKICLLDISDDAISNRLKWRYQTKKSIEELKRAVWINVETFIQENIKFAIALRWLFKKYNCEIINTSNDTIEESIKKVITWINNS
jgi:hypothetical protein